MGSIRERTISVIEDNWSRKFVYGEWDCSIFCFECIIPDEVGLIKGTYSDHDGAQARIEALGGYDQCARDLGGVPLEDLAMMRTGDLAELNLGPNIDNPLGVVQADRVVCNQYSGIVRYPRELVIAAWRFD